MIRARDMAMSDPILTIDCVTKRYGVRTAIGNVSMSIQPGEVYGLLGPNGAGKTTLMRVVLGRLRANSGTITLFGEVNGGHRPTVRRRIGVAPEKPYLYFNMTAREYLLFFARLYGARAPREATNNTLDRLGLAPHADGRLAAFSHGMQQRVNLARAFVHDPDLVVLDEPVSGLDPYGMKIVRDMIVAARNQGRSVIISSHILTIVENICGRVAILDKGKLLAEETVAKIHARIGNSARVNVEVSQSDERTLRALRQFDFVQTAAASTSAYNLTIRDVPDARERISRCIAEAGAAVLSVTFEQSSLEDRYLEITRHNVASLA